MQRRSDHRDSPKLAGTEGPAAKSGRSLRAKLIVCKLCYVPRHFQGQKNRLAIPSSERITGVTKFISLGAKKLIDYILTTKFPPHLFKVNQLIQQLHHHFTNTMLLT
jgi:hypothetical protein